MDNTKSERGEIWFQGVIGSSLVMHAANGRRFGRGNAVPSSAVAEGRLAPASEDGYRSLCST
jgi:hypothetical protein